MKLRRIYKHGILESEWNQFKQVIYENYMIELNECNLNLEVYSILFHNL